MAMYKGREVRVVAIVDDTPARIKIEHQGTQEVEIVNEDQVLYTDPERDQLLKTEQDKLDVKKRKYDEFKKQQKADEDKAKSAQKVEDKPATPPVAKTKAQ